MHAEIIFEVLFNFLFAVPKMTGSQRSPIFEPSMLLDDPASWIFGPSALEIFNLETLKVVASFLRLLTVQGQILYTMHARPRTIVVVSAVLGFLAILTVTGRFWARRIQRQKFGIDDALLIIALVSRPDSVLKYHQGCIDLFG